jgi:hypothetical protein
VQAIASWRDNSGFGRTQLVKSYFQCVEGFTEPEVLLQVPIPEGQDQGLLGGLLKALPQPLQQLLSRSSSDPFYAVLAYRNFKPEYS